MDAITKTAFAVELGVTKGRVSQYVKSGMPVQEDGKINRVEALNWLNSKRLNLTPGVKGLNHAAAAVKARDRPADVPRDVGLDETTFELERTRKLKLENDERERLLISRQTFIDAFYLATGSSLVAFAALPARVSDDLAVRRTVETEIDVLRNDHATRVQRILDDILGGKDPIAALVGDEPEEVDAD